MTDVSAVSVLNVFTTTNELKGKVTTRISRDDQLEFITVYVSRQCACSRLWEATSSVDLNSLQTSVYDEQLMSMGDEIAVSRNTSSHQWRRSRHSVYLRFQSFTRATISNHFCVRDIHNPYDCTITHLPHFRQFQQSCWNQSIICIHRIFSIFDSFLIFAILTSLNLFLTVSFISIVLNCKLDFLGFLDSFGFLVHRLSARISLSDLCTEFPTFDLPSVFVNMSAEFDSVNTYTTRKCFAATRSCSQSILVCMWRMLLSVPLRETITFALEESVCSQSCSFRFQSTILTSLPSWVCATETNHVCTVELCLSKCRPRRAITPDVRRRVTVSPAQSLPTCTSKCALLDSWAGDCRVFLDTPFRYLVTRFDCIMWSALDFDITRVRHLIVSEMSTLPCVKYVLVWFHSD